jgi:hypothetical protein
MIRSSEFSDAYLGVSGPVPVFKTGVKMTISVIGFYRGGTVEDVRPLAKRMKSILLRHGVDYQVKSTNGSRDSWPMQ